MHDAGVVSAIELDGKDWEDFCQAREAMREVLKRKLDPIWGFVHTRADPLVKWEGCQIRRAV